MAPWPHGPIAVGPIALASVIVESAIVASAIVASAITLGSAEGIAGAAESEAERADAAEGAGEAEGWKLGGLLLPGPGAVYRVQGRADEAPEEENAEVESTEEDTDESTWLDLT